MNYKLVYTRKAEKDIKKLDPTIKKIYWEISSETPG